MSGVRTSRPRGDSAAGQVQPRHASQLGMLLSQGVMEILGLTAHQLSPLMCATLTPLVEVAIIFFFDWYIALIAKVIFSLVALLVMINRVIDPLTEVAAYSSGICMASAQMDAVERALAEQPLPQADDPRPYSGEASIQLHNVTFGHQPEQPILKNVSVTLPANTTTELVGLAGAGKTILMRLIARFFDPDYGSITLGGTDLRQLSSREHM